MLRSIRWRLILSYMFIALLTVGVVGVVTYRLVRDNLRAMERQSLVDNAEAVARQAYGLMQPQVATGELRQLAQTAAFLGDVRVQVLDTQGRVIADSDTAANDGQLVLMLPGGIRELWGPRPPFGRAPLFVEIDPDTHFHLPDPFAEALTERTRVTVIRRGGGLWGGRLVFGEVMPGEVGATARGLESEPVPRSDVAVTAPIAGDAGVPVGYVELSEPPALNTTLLDQLRQALAIAGGGAVVVAGLFGFWRSHRMAAPIKALAQTAAQMGAGDLTVRADVGNRGRAGSEISELATQFNGMADSLQSSFDALAAERDALRRFIADASHELRTPITALSNFNTLLLDGADADAATRREFLAESRAQIERLAWITSHLLDLSRRDAGLVPLDLADHDVREIVCSAVAPFEPRAEARGVEVRTELPDKSLDVVCDRAQVEIALTNLVDNALKFTQPGDSVVVSAAGTPDGVAVTVADTGVGIAPDDLPHVFERFYQGRHPGAKGTGAGLGLAIVKSIVEAHGGTVALDSTLATGTRVTIELPRRAPARPNAVSARKP